MEVQQELNRDQNQKTISQEIFDNKDKEVPDEVKMLHSQWLNSSETKTFLSNLIEEQSLNIANIVSLAPVMQVDDKTLRFALIPVHTRQQIINYAQNPLCIVRSSRK